MEKVKVVCKSGRMPKYETEGSAGMDITAFLDENICIAPGERLLVPTGLYIELPVGYEAQIRARSGLAIKEGISLVNGIGTIDSDYRGEIKVAIINHGSKDYVIEDGDRIAQMVISKYERANLIQCDDLEQTERGAGGFGHTGVK